MRCQDCQFENENEARFCVNCGAAIQAVNYPAQAVNTTPHQLVCPRCGAANLPGSAYCENCGTMIDQKPPAGAFTPPPNGSQISVKNAVVHTSSAWWLLPLFLTWVGGLIAWVVIRDNDKAKANRLLIFGIVMTFIWIVVGFGISLLGFLMETGFS